VIVSQFKFREFKPGAIGEREKLNTPAFQAIVWIFKDYVTLSFKQAGSFIDGNLVGTDTLLGPLQGNITGKTNFLAIVAVNGLRLNLCFIADIDQFSVFKAGHTAQIPVLGGEAVFGGNRQQQAGKQKVSQA
jgi:hypothetical protein